MGKIYPDFVGAFTNSLRVDGILYVEWTEFGQAQRSTEESADFFAKEAAGSV